MTTKYKMIAGFVSMIVLLLASSFLGYNYLNKSIDGLVEYRRLARMNVRTSDSYTELNAAGLAANRLTASRSMDDANAALAALDKLDSTIQQARADMSNADRIATIDRIRENIRKYRESVNQLATAVTTVQTQYQGMVVPYSRELSDAFQTISETAASVGNANMLLLLEKSWSEYAFMLSALSRYYYGREEADLKIIRERMAAMQPILQSMDGAIRMQNVRELYDGTLMPSIEHIFSAVDELIKASENANMALKVCLDNRVAIERELAALSTYYDQEMTRYGVAVTDESRSGQSMLLYGSIGGVLIGLALAVLIIMGLVRVLADLAGYAGNIAAGNFAYQPKSREKGEVGAMIHAMHDIPEILNKFTTKANEVADRILIGDYRNRLNTADFPGSFKDMAQSITTVSDAYTQTLDQIPLAIITADLDNKMLFINSATKTVLGSDMTGRNCGQCFKSPVCGNDKCFASMAKNNKRPYTGETTIHPDSGNNLTISVTAIPFFDKAGALRGHLEICADISELKNKQDTILEVAKQATGISDRIATASEELSAQVEQVSRGAEIQRDRVSSTASAMTEMNSTVIEVAKNAGEASEQSEHTRQKAQEGAELVNQVVKAINAVNVIGQALRENMQELGKQAESIGGVMNVIADIADQTNLLALNAAIEAARAGEAGRGFAVVADEVRKLAEKTMQATHEVGSSINAIQQSAQVNVAEVNKAVTSVGEADKLAISSGEALNEIVHLAAQNSSVVASIATASEEQSATSEEISNSTEEINRIVAETAEGMVQSSAAVQELSSMAQELRLVMDGLK